MRIDGHVSDLRFDTGTRHKDRANMKETAMTITHTVNVLMFCAAFVFVGAIALGVF